MKHHVSCVVCGKKDFIPVGNGIEKKAGWFYGGKVNVNLNQKEKPNLAEYWECPKCSAPLNANRSIKEGEHEQT